MGRKEKPTRTTTNKKKKKKRRTTINRTFTEYTTKSGQTVNASSQDIRHSGCNVTDKEGTSYINITKPSHPERVLYRITLIIIPTPSEGYGFDGLVILM